jgi:hypothetical protein
VKRTYGLGRKEEPVKKMIVLAIGVTLTLTTLLAGTAAAAKPTITSLEGVTDLGNLNEGPAGDICSFDVGLVITAGPGARQIEFSSPMNNGATALLAGPLKATATNLETGESITVGISGPTWLGPDGLPTKGTGSWLVFEPIAEGGLRFIHGRLAFEPVSYGVHAIVLGGTEEDLCERLA